MSVRKGASTFARLPDRQVNELALRSSDGDELAFTALCRYLNGLLHSIALDYYGPGLMHDDLVQEARIGLHAATLSWDPSHGIPFASFAAVAVRRRVMSAVKSSHALKRGPLADSLSFEEPRGDRTIGDYLAASPFVDPAHILDVRDDLRRLTEHLVATMSETEAIVLARVLNGASFEEAGQGLGSGRASKLADNALSRVRRKAAEVLVA